MVQIIPPGTPRKSTAQKFNMAMQSGMDMLQQYQQNKQKEEAFRNLGIDPAIANLPPEGQAAYFKQIFAPKKEETLLEKAQRLKYEQQAESSKASQRRVGQILGETEPQEPIQMGAENPVQMGAEGPQQQQPVRKKIEDYSDEDLGHLVAFKNDPDPNNKYIANIAEQEQQKRLQKEKLERTEKTEKEKLGFEREKLERREAAEVTKPLMLELQQSRKNIPLQEQAIEDIKNAAPEVGALDYFADVTGFEPLRSAEGAKLKTAIKDFFLSDLTRVGARPNQWIEQQLADALPKLGRSPEANLITAAGMKFKVDLAKKRIELIDDLSDQDREKYGFVKGNIDSRANALMKPFVEQRKKDLIDEITKIKSDNKVEKGFTRMKNPETGETYDILEKNVKEAKKAGWQVI
jgi:hypothetical protein